MGKLLSDWSVDYGDGNGSHKITVPHAWRQEVPVEFEGPVRYSCSIDVPRSGAWVLFHAASYFARLSVHGNEIGWHEGMWDAFSVSLERFKGKSITLEVEVTKPGGSRFPIDTVACGFLPYLHHSFGGLWGDVEIFDGSADPLAFLPGPTSPRLELKDKQILLDGNPFFMRGLLHQGWYPKLGHCAPDEATIRQELEAVLALGFNTVKFGLWIPPHRYLELMEELGLVAWIQLPLFQPAESIDWDRITQEFERLVRQYRHHRSIIAWTLGSPGPGSEMALPSFFRKRLVRLIKSLTGCPLVGDGGGTSRSDPREFGTFSEYSVAGGLPIYQPLLSLLGPAAVRSRPTFLGSFTDLDVHRDVARLLEDHPYWASVLPEFNARGVRLNNDLASVLRSSRYAHEPRASGHEELIRSSASMATFVRRRAIEDARSMTGLSGYVLANWRDTPISAGGIFDDWGNPRTSTQEILACNASAALFLLPDPAPTSQSGMLKTSFHDRNNVWCGPNLWQLGIHSERELRSGGLWRILRDGAVFAEGTLELRKIPALMATEVGEIFAELDAPGEYELRAEFGGVASSWTIQAVDRSSKAIQGMIVADLSQLSSSLATDLKVQAAEFGIQVSETVPETGTFVYVISQAGDYGDYKAHEAPFWEHAAYEFAPELPFANKWGWLKPVHATLALSNGGFTSDSELLMRRIDTLSYEESGVVVRLKNGSILTTLWPWGGLEGQRHGLPNNPAGVQLLRELLKLASP